MFLPHEGLHSHVAVAPESHHLREEGFLTEEDLCLILLKEGARLCPDNVGWVEQLLFYCLVLQMNCDVVMNEMFYLVRGDLTLANLDDATGVPNQPRIISKANQDSWRNYNWQGVNFS